MYSFLNDAVESKLIRLLREEAKRNPAYRDRVTQFIIDSFNLQEAPTEGVFLTDVSANHEPLAAQNFVGTALSHVFAAQTEPTEGQEWTGTFVEWVREDPSYYTLDLEEDLTSQIPVGGTDTFFASETRIIAGYNDDVLARLEDVRVQVDEVAQHPTAVNGDTGEIQIGGWVYPNSTVHAFYRVSRRPKNPGLYYLQVAGDRVLSRAYLGIAKRELLIDSYGGETTLTLSNTPVIKGSVRIFTLHSYPLTENVHYQVDLDTGEVTFLHPDLPQGQPLYVSYKWDGGQDDGIPFEPGTSSNHIVPGVVVAFGEKVEVGQLAVVGLMRDREYTADIYGGRWNVSVSLNVFARDPDTRQEIVDWFSTAVLARLKPELDNAGQALVEVSVGGKSRNTYYEGGREYFTQNISLTLQTDWETHQAVPIEIEGFRLEIPNETQLIQPRPLIPVGSFQPDNFAYAFNARERYK